MVPAFLYSLHWTLYKTDISLRRTLPVSAGPKDFLLSERVGCMYMFSTTVKLVALPFVRPCKSALTMTFLQFLTVSVTHVFCVVTSPLLQSTLGKRKKILLLIVCLHIRVSIPLCLNLYFVFSEASV